MSRLWSLPDYPVLNVKQLIARNSSPSHHHELEVLLEAKLPQLHAVSCSLPFHLTNERLLAIIHSVMFTKLIVHLQIQQLLPLWSNTSFFHDLDLKDF